MNHFPGRCRTSSSSSVGESLKISFEAHCAPHVRRNSCIAYLDEATFRLDQHASRIRCRAIPSMLDAVSCLRKKHAPMPHRWHSLVRIPTGSRNVFFSARGIFGPSFLNQSLLLFEPESTNSRPSRRIVPVLTVSKVAQGSKVRPSV